MNLSELLLTATKEKEPVGEINGTCVICCQETEQGVSIKQCVSGNFMGWSYLFAGNCMCPKCAFLFSDQTFRRKSWVASPKGFWTFKNDEAANVLFNPPEPPFFIHLAKLGQRQTWLACLHRVAHNRNRYFFSHEKYDVPILFERSKAELYADKVLKALELSISKTELLAGEFKSKTWKKAFQSGHQDFLRELAKFKNDPLWEVIVDVGRRTRTDGETDDRAAGDSV